MDGERQEQNPAERSRVCMILSQFPEGSPDDSWSLEGRQRCQLGSTGCIRGSGRAEA